jgi:hypothetical protein
MGVSEWAYQLRKYKPNRKVKSLTASYIRVRPSIHDELNYRYSQYSKSYWEGVKERQKAYLLKTYGN